MKPQPIISQDFLHPSILHFLTLLGEDHPSQDILLRAEGFCIVLDLARRTSNKKYCTRVPPDVYLPDPPSSLEAETSYGLKTCYKTLGLGPVPKRLDHLESLYSKEAKPRVRTSLTLVVESDLTGMTSKSS